MRFATTSPHTLLAVLGFAALITGGCADEPRKVFGDMRWQLYCDQGCSGIEAHDVNGFDGENGISVSCSVQKSSDIYTFSFSAIGRADGERFSLSATNITTTSTGGVVTGTSRISADEQGDLYRGDATSSPPSAEAPCQIRNVTVGDGDAGPEFTGEIHCGTATEDDEVGLAARSDQTVLRNLGGPLEEESFGTFRFVNCSGL